MGVIARPSPSILPHRSALPARSPVREAGFCSVAIDGNGDEALLVAIARPNLTLSSILFQLLRKQEQDKVILKQGRQRLMLFVLLFSCCFLSHER